MSLLSAIEEAIKTCKVDQAKLNDGIERSREILQSLTSQHAAEPEETEKPADASAGEKEDMELLERALEKALRVRAGSEPSKKESCRNRLSGAPSDAVTTTDVLISSAVAKEGRSTSKSARPDRKGDNKSGLASGSTLRSGPQSKPGSYRASSARAAHRQASRTFQQTVSASASPDQITASLPKNKTARGAVAGAGDPPAVSLSDARGSGTSRWPPHNMSQSEQTKWKSLRSKQNRLWGKAVSLQRKPAPGRSHFMERMRATFPTDWPCGSPDHTRALLDRLTDQGLNLAERCRAEEILTKQASEVETELGGKQNQCDPSLTREALQQTAAELQIFTNQVSKEWKAWDRWRPEGGCLCPAWGDGGASSLPLTITYRTEKELQELEGLRMRVALLQQELHLDQVLMDTLSPHLSSIAPGPRCPHPGMLRDLYALLGEGGERFPAIVLDSEAEGACFTES